MPLYEYQCDNCGQRFEVMQKFVDQPLTQHEACGGGPVHRLLSAPALQFKGSGFYITDYAKGSTSAPPSANGEGGKSAKSDSSASAGTSSSDAGSKKSADSGNKGSSSSASSSTSSSSGDKS